MKRNITIKEITINALIASLCIASNLLLGPLSSGANGMFQIRLAEIFMVFALISPKYFIGLIIGCLVSNIFGGIPLDIFVGTFQTIISCLILYFFRKRPHIAILLSSILCGVMIGLELYLLGFASIGIFIIFSIFISEMITLEFGYFAIYLTILKKNIDNL